jgi:hypothetical protein
MSIEAVGWALNVPVGGNEKVVLLGIANHCRPDGTEAWPSLETLARYAACDRSTARRNLRKLEEAGWIVRSGEGPRGTVSWSLPGGWQNATVAPVPAGGGTSAPEGVAPAPPEPSLEPSGVARATARTPARGPLSPEELRALTEVQRHVLIRLREVAAAKRARLVERAALEACAAFPDRDLMHEATQLHWWHTEGRGRNRRVLDLNAGWRNWLRGAPPAGGGGQRRPRPGSGASAMDFARLAIEESS